MSAPQRAALQSGVASSLATRFGTRHEALRRDPNPNPNPNPNPKPTPNPNQVLRALAATKPSVPTLRMTLRVRTPRLNLPLTMVPGLHLPLTMVLGLPLPLTMPLRRTLTR